MKTGPYCPRCGGMMQRERYYAAGEAFEGLKCLACGECVDPLILLNRMNPGAKIPSDTGNVLDLLRQIIAGAKSAL